METERKILAYLDGIMNQEEIREFEAALKHNPELARDLALFTEVNEAIREDDIANFRQKMKHIMAKHSHHNPFKSGIVGWMKYAAAAMIAIIVGVSIWHFTRKTETEDLYAVYYQTYSSHFITRSSDTNSMYGNPVPVLYQQGFYEQACIAARERLQEYPEDTESRFYLGIAALHLNLPDTAIVHLKRIDKLSSAENLPDIRWYLAMAYLKKKDSRHAREFLQQLKAPRNVYTSRAKEILIKMKQK